MGPLDGAHAPLFDLLVDLLIEPADRTRRDPSAPQGLGDVLHPPDRNAGHVHLDESHLHRTLPPAISLHNGGLKGELPKLRHLQLYPARLGIQVALS